MIEKHGGAEMACAANRRTDAYPTGRVVSNW